MSDDLDKDLARIQRQKVNPVLPGFGVVVGVIPFFVNLRMSRESTTTVTENGVEIRSVTRRNAFDQVAVPCAAFAFAMGFVGLVRGAAARKLVVILVSLASLALGVVQAVRGFSR
jgi:hypothetical protein